LNMGVYLAFLDNRKCFCVCQTHNFFSP
jgi:hypothetical protein